MRDTSGYTVCNFLWGEGASHTFSGLLISLQRSKQLLQSHSVITEKCLRLHPCYPACPAPGMDLKIALCAISCQTHYFAVHALVNMKPIPIGVVQTVNRKL